MPGGLCFLHANPDKAGVEARPGLRCRRAPAEYISRPLKTVDDVTGLLADTINDLRSGSIDSRIANTVGYLATGMLKALDLRIPCASAILNSQQLKVISFSDSKQQMLRIGSLTDTTRQVRRTHHPTRQMK